MNIFKYLETHHDEDGFTPCEASFPVAGPPGSGEKFWAIVARAERGEELFHPLDSNLPLDREGDGNFFRENLSNDY